MGREVDPDVAPAATPVDRVVHPSGEGVHIVDLSLTPGLHGIAASTFLSVVDVSGRPVALGRTVVEVGMEGVWSVDFSVSVVQGMSTYYSCQSYAQGPSPGVFYVFSFALPASTSNFGFGSARLASISC